MNKQDLKNLGLYMITPLPQKYHFEGVDNVKIAKQLTRFALGTQAALLVTVFFGPVIVNKASDLKDKFKNRKKN